jgi:acetolactate synthase II small subunit
MKSVLELRLNNAEGVLERVLGCLRQRGFELCSFTMERSSDATHLTVRCEVESHRPIEIGCRQLAKLYDVQSIKVHAETMVVEGFAHNEKTNEREVCLSV